MVFKDEDVIFAYSRKDAIQDGVLIDVVTMAKAAGFRIHVALTSTVFERYVSESDKLTGIDYDGRLWDVLQALRYAIKTGDKRQSQILFKLVDNGNTAQTVTLKAVCGRDDDAKPCITIMLPEED
jgi:hypothetical protein